LRCAKVVVRWAPASSVKLSSSVPIGLKANWQLYVIRYWLMVLKEDNRILYLTPKKPKTEVVIESE